MTTFWSNLFGRTVRTEKEGDSYFHILSGTTTDMPYKSLFEIYLNIPHLRSVINKYAEFYSNIRFKIVSTKTSEDQINTDHNLNVVLDSPNILQSWRQMLYMIGIYKCVSGIAFLYPGFGFSRSAKNLQFIKNIDYNDYKIDERHGKNILNSNDLSEIIERVRFTMDTGNQIIYDDIQDLIMVKDSFDSYLKNHSKITTLQLPIENIYKALVNRGILIDKKGGVGILSGNQKDGGVQVPMKPLERKKLNSKLNGYGLGAGKEPIILTDVPLKWQSMVFPTNQLMLFEEIVDDFNTICDEFGMARELFVGDAAYAATRRQAEEDTYTNTILPAWTDLFSLLNKSLNTKKESIRIDMDFSHIKALTANEKQNIETQAAKSTMLLAEVDKLLITPQEYRQQMGYDKK